MLRGSGEFELLRVRVIGVQLYSMSVTLYKISDVSFRLLGTNGLDAKAKNEKFNAVGSRCRQNLKYENLTSSFGRLRQKNATKSLPHMQHDYFSSFNRSYHRFVALPLAFLKHRFDLERTRLNDSTLHFVPSIQRRETTKGKEQKK